MPRLFLAGLQKYSPFGAAYSSRIQLNGYSGGPAGTVYGYLLAWLGSMAVVTTISELSSM